MEPEISTRCVECGAAIRPQSLFCPECGRPAGTKDPAREPTGADTHATDDEQNGEGISNEDLAADDESEDAIALEAASEPAAAAEATVDPLSDRLAKLKAAAEADPAAPVVIVASKPAAKPATRIKRSEKGKQVYSRFSKLRVPAVVPKEALEPGMRFLVVAGALFLFALITFFLSQYFR